MYKFLMIFMLFMTYSAIGWVMELIVVSLEQKKIVKSRGFFIGPYCPIYGFSSILMIFVLSQYKEDPWVLFVMAMLLCTTVEYLTSLIMEKIFKIRWWDYSHMKFNLNGRVCLTNSVLFGALGLFLIHVLNPFVVSRFVQIPNKIFIGTAIFVLIIFISDLIISMEIICRIKVTADNLRKDYTEEITKKVKDILGKKSYFTRRIFESFPGIKFITTISDKIIPKKKPKQK